ncbi:hypothetical protein MKW98_016025 [Papaver atlanticum]|uniref:Uncharacterized protein n=1 Tax=Papaver atlanticum TaxID=357466 RepID=A0AAD4RVF3_9MAGN|nr:hypothetical protein MKW98_016025 [Papaver atlanticum]
MISAVFVTETHNGSRERKSTNIESEKTSLTQESKYQLRPQLVSTVRRQLKSDDWNNGFDLS